MSVYRLPCVKNERNRLFFYALVGVVMFVSCEAAVRKSQNANSSGKFSKKFLCKIACSILRI